MALPGTRERASKGGCSFARSYDGHMSVIIRAVMPNDWPAVAAIFNHYVKTSPAAYPEDPVAESFFRDRHNAALDYPFLVALDGARIVGFGSLRSIHPAATLRRAAQLGYFLAPEHTGRGIGSLLLGALIEAGRRMGVDTFLAHISSLNDGSIRFHLRHGFTECGRFRRVGRKHGRDFDMVWMQLTP
jgi:L-amino acid N-acyltransferase YncA